MGKKSNAAAEAVSNVSTFVSKLAAYADLFERLLDTVILVDIHLHSILDINSSGARILGETKESILGRALSDWVEEKQRPALAALLESSKSLKFAQNRIMSWALLDGRRVTFDLSVCALSLSNGQRILQVIARDITLELDLKRKTLSELRDFKDQSLKDELTGLSNYRHFQSLLHSKHQEARDANRPYSILFFDVDHFKSYNDRNGHPAGDTLLGELSRIIRATCRADDLPARYGGEEFAILSFGSDKATALRIAERIRSAVEGHSFPHGKAQPLGALTVSIGVASYPDDGTEPHEIVQAADEASYRSKRNGRNRVTAW